MSREEKLTLLANEETSGDDQAPAASAVVDIKYQKEPIRLPEEITCLIATFLDPLLYYSLRRALSSVPRYIRLSVDALATLALGIQSLDLTAFSDLKCVRDCEEIKPLIAAVKTQLQRDELESNCLIEYHLASFVCLALLDKQASYQQSALYKTQIENQPHKDLMNRIRSVNNLANNFLYSLPHFVIKKNKKQLWVGPCQLTSKYASRWRNLTSIFCVRLNLSQNNLRQNLFGVGFEDTLRLLINRYNTKWRDLERERKESLSSWVCFLGSLIGPVVVTAILGAIPSIILFLCGKKDAALQCAYGFIALGATLSCLLSFLHCLILECNCDFMSSNESVRLFYNAFANDLVKSPETFKVTKKDAVDLEKIQRLSAFWRLAKQDRTEQLAALSAVKNTS